LNNCLIDYFFQLQKIYIKAGLQYPAFFFADSLLSSAYKTGKIGF